MGNEMILRNNLNWEVRVFAQKFQSSGDFIVILRNVSLLFKSFNRNIWDQVDPLA